MSWVVAKTCTWHRITSCLHTQVQLEAGHFVGEMAVMKEFTHEIPKEPIVVIVVVFTAHVAVAVASSRCK